MAEHPPFQSETIERVGPQLLIIMVGLVLWAVYPLPRFAALLAAYLVALFGVNYALRYFRRRELLPVKKSLITTSCVAIVAAAVPIATLVSMLPQISKDEFLTRVVTLNRDRLRLEATPSITPHLVFTDHPQRFFIHALDAKQVELKWSARHASLAAESLGHGLFRLDYNPRNDTTDLVNGEKLNCQLFVDGVTYTRTLKTVSRQPHPRWFSSVPKQGIAATVSEETDELILVRRNGSHRRIPVGDGPTDCTFLDNGNKIAVSHRFSPELWVIDVASRKVEKRVAASQFQTRMAISPNGQELAVAQASQESGIQFYFLPEFEPFDFLPLSFMPDWLCYGRDGTELFVTSRQDKTINRIKDLLVRDKATLPRPVLSMGRDESGERILISTTAASTDAEQITANHFIENTLHFIDTSHGKITETLITDRRSHRQEYPGNADRGGSPMGMCVYAETVVMVAFAGTNEVWLIEPKTGKIVEQIDLEPHGIRAPHGVADLGGGRWCVSSPSSGSISVFDGDGELRTQIHLAPNDAELVKADSNLLQRRHGEQSFYEETRSGISCQSCHMHADTDFSLHNIGQATLVDNLTVRGVAGTSPFLRNASYDRLRDLHEVAEGLYRGYRREVEWDRPKAIEAYMNGLPKPVNWRAFASEDIERTRAGVSAFVKAECVRCHSFPAFTNLAQHPAALIFPKYVAGHGSLSQFPTKLDTPSLVNLSLFPPYLHDGRAATIRDVLRNQNLSNRHGNVKRLTDEEFDSLIYFLERL